MYAEALEQQLRLRRWLKGPDGERVMRQIIAHCEPEYQGPHAAENARHAIGLALERADPFWWSGALSRMVTEMAPTLPSWTLTLEDLPAEAGFFWFSSPIPLPWGTRRPQYLRAISWLPIVHEEAAAQRFIDFAYWIVEDRPTTPYPMFRWEWAVGATLAEAIGEEQEYIGPLCRVVAASWVLLAQRIIVAPRHPAERPAARRLKREGYPHEPLVRVVELRRVEHGGVRAGDPEPVEWSCRWLVRGHWRQQPYGPGQAQRRPTWIAPHLKGPDEKPLKPPRATVFAVVR